MDTGTTRTRRSLSPRVHLWNSDSDHRPACLVADGLKTGGLRYMAFGPSGFADLPEQMTCARCRRIAADRQQWEG